MSAVTRFIENTVTAFTGEMSAMQSINKLEVEIYLLHEWLLNNEPGTDTWKEKRAAMLRKIENLNEIKAENN